MAEAFVMREELIYIAIGALFIMIYMTMGIGVARTQKKFRLFIVFFWPVVLGVIAATGEIAE